MFCLVGPRPLCSPKYYWSRVEEWSLATPTLSTKHGEWIKMQRQQQLIRWKLPRPRSLSATPLERRATAVAPKFLSLRSTRWRRVTCSGHWLTRADETELPALKTSFVPHTLEMSPTALSVFSRTQSTGELHTVNGIAKKKKKKTPLHGFLRKLFVLQRFMGKAKPLIIFCDTGQRILMRKIEQVCEYY